MSHAEQIFVAEAAGAPMVSVPRVRAVADRGLEGDRYFAGVGTFSRWPGEGRAVSLIEAEAIEAILREHNIDLSGGRARRNVVTRGVRLHDLVGRTFRVGAAILRGTRLCTECRYLERVTQPGVFAALKHRGGLRADVVTGGEIRVGDAVG
ncbi:MAG TPA: MOSC domain-containing protein [Tepidisphaeraceae bacterium]|nr:MOSC domain-containing protein [Tepidisphaeraceae bacterium]